MNKYVRKFGWILLISVPIISLQACSLIPKDEKNYQVQVVHKDVTADYSLVAAQIDDVVKTKEIPCYYEQVNQEKLSFHKSGLNIAGVFVQIGDQVKKGDVLACLDTKDMRNELEDYKDQVEINKLLLKQAKESYGFYQSKIDAKDCKAEDKERYLIKLQDYDEKSREYTDEITLLKQKIDKIRQEIRESDIIAGMDGSVTYISDVILSGKSIADQEVITVADTKDCAFLTDDKEAAKYLKAGQEVDIIISEDKSYQAVVNANNKNKSKISLRIKDDDYTMESGTRGVIKLVLASKKQVLTIPKEALHSTEDFKYVYDINANGVRDYKKVSVGLIGDTLVEITKGLKENEAVIMNNP